MTGEEFHRRRSAGWLPMVVKVLRDFRRRDGSVLDKGDTAFLEWHDWKFHLVWDKDTLMPVYPEEFEVIVWRAA
jgi:hypothetical protein